MSHQVVVVSSNLDPPAKNTRDLNLIPFPIEPSGRDPTGMQEDSATTCNSDTNPTTETLAAVGGEATFYLQIPSLHSPEAHAVKRARLPSPNTQRVLDNVDIAYNEASKAIADFGKRSINQITKEGEGEEEMNLPRLFTEGPAEDPGWIPEDEDPEL